MKMKNHQNKQTPPKNIPTKKQPKGNKQVVTIISSIK